MTQTAKKLIRALEQLPNDEQERRAASYLEDLKRHLNAQEKEEAVPPYASFTYLQKVNLDLPPDYSETYEEHLYGIKKNDDE